MTKPLSPDEIATKKIITFPDEVFEAFNELIAKGFRGNQSIVYQDDVVEEIQQKMGLDNNRKIFAEGWLNIEDAYRIVGWNVEYDKPTYWAGENFRAHYTFTKRRSQNV